MKRYVLISMIITAGLVIFEEERIDAATVRVGDREWMMLTDTSGLFSYNMMADIYDLDTGELKGPGLFEGVDFTGWTWASHADVKDMLRRFTGLNLLDAVRGDGSIQDGEKDSTWAPRFVSAFGITRVRSEWVTSKGFTREGPSHE